MKSGGQPGNQNAAKEKRWANAINTALSNRCKSDGQKALVELAEKMLAAADKGEAWAIKELGDRLDGKPAQSLSVGSDEESPLRVVTQVLIGRLEADDDSKD
ncbi:MAG: hypothetical protein GY941_20460 [Planctomycetes bacterium]|nr:hypothetical protein [Planctomycetota bacterium]